MAAVATASRLSKRDAALAEVLMSPSSNSAGPTTPPARMAPPSQGRSARESGVSVVRPERNRSQSEKAEARAEIKQTRDEERIGGRKNEFCERSARTEKQCCAKRNKDTGVSAHRSLLINDRLAHRFVEAGPLVNRIPHVAGAES
jgi:hypothetical protein